MLGLVVTLGSLAASWWGGKRLARKLAPAAVTPPGPVSSSGATTSAASSGGDAAAVVVVAPPSGMPPTPHGDRGGWDTPVDDGKPRPGADELDDWRLALPAGRRPPTDPSWERVVVGTGASIGAQQVASAVNATPLGVASKVVGLPGVAALELAGINDPKAAAALTNPIGTVVGGVAGAIVDAFSITHERPLTPEQWAAYDAAVADPTKAAGFASAMGTRGTKQVLGSDGEYQEMGANAREDEIASW